MPNLVGQRQLGHFRRHTTVVIHKRNDAGVQRTLRTLIQSANGFRVRFVLFTNATGRSGRRCDPSQAERAARKVTIREHVRQAEDLMIAQRMQIEEIRHIDVFHTERIRIAVVRFLACGIVVDFDALHLESNVAMLDSSIELCVAVNVIDGRHMMGDQG